VLTPRLSVDPLSASRGSAASSSLPWDLATKKKLSRSRAYYTVVTKTFTTCDQGKGNDEARTWPPRGGQKLSVSASSRSQPHSLRSGVRPTALTPSGSQKQHPGAADGRPNRRLALAIPHRRRESFRPIPGADGAAGVMMKRPGRSSRPPPAISTLQRRHCSTEHL
jgi:hypothetical protein